MNPLTQVKNTQKITAREQAIGISEEGSWHAKFKSSGYAYVGDLPFDLTEGDVLAVFSQLQAFWRWLLCVQRLNFHQELQYCRNLSSGTTFRFLRNHNPRRRSFRRHLRSLFDPREKVMELSDRAVGFLLLLISTTLFAYYTFWVIITPFVDTDHFVHNYFPDREYAIIIPGLAGAALLSFVLIFVGVVMVKSSHPKPMSKPKTT